MASQRDIRRRISSVQNTRKITKAMEMVAAARLRRAQMRIESTRPYALNMLEFIGQLVQYLQVDLSAHPLLKPHDKVKKVAVIAITSDRGLAGAFNSNIVRKALDLIDKYTAEGVDSDLVLLGRRGANTVRFQGYHMDKVYLDVTERTAFLEAQALTNGVIRRYVNEQIDRVHLVFNRFKSPMEQYVTDQVILPIQEEVTGLFIPKDEQVKHMDFLFEPSPEEMFADLLPSYVEITIYRAILESMASEHGARMTAMRAASEAADEMVNELTLAMNRVRQYTITQEILEVVAGADALSG
jgi:F-type H+-transporting ATPase subunit gamma